MADEAKMKSERETLADALLGYFGIGVSRSTSWRPTAREEALAQADYLLSNLPGELQAKIERYERALVKIEDLMEKAQDDYDDYGPQAYDNAIGSAEVIARHALRPGAP